MNPTTLPAPTDNDRWLLHAGARALTVDRGAVTKPAPSDVEGLRPAGILVTRGAPVRDAEHALR